MPEKKKKEIQEKTSLSFGRGASSDASIVIKALLLRT